MMHSALLKLSRREISEEIPDASRVMAQSGGENFPVAARVLARRERRHLLALYGFARLADELGDELEGDRLASLDWLQGEVDRAYRGNARHPLLERLQRTLTECDLPREPLLRLIEANRIDQRVTRYETWEQLQGYCELSANPVGELVLCIFGLATPERIALSNRVCTALQLVEHLQDLGEDLRRGRVYLPAEDLARFGSSHEQLAEVASRGAEVASRGAEVASRGAEVASRGGMDLDLGGVLAGSSARTEEDRRRAHRLREAISFEAARARQLLAAGVPLVRDIPGRPKLAIGAFVAGGDAALDEIERARFDVLGEVPSASRYRRLRALARVLAESRA
jgi:squalene synthase HpnC